MPDEIPVRPEEHGPDDDGGDPEVPLVPHSAESSHKKTNADVEAHATAEHIHQAFYSIRMFFVRVWTHKPSAIDWTALGTMIVAIITVLGTVYVYSQREIVFDQWQEMVESGRDARKAQWAHVDIPQQLQVHTVVENGKVTFWAPEITMVNNGNTGTYNTLEIVSVSASQTEMPQDCGYHDNGKPQHGDLGPREAELFDAQPIPISAIESIQNGSHVYIYGWAEYWDVFQFYGNKKLEYTPHLREFCYELRLDSIPGDVTSPDYVPPKRMILYGTRNCTDGDCVDYCEKTRVWRSQLCDTSRCQPTQ